VAYNKTRVAVPASGGSPTASCRATTWRPTGNSAIPVRVASAQRLGRTAPFRFGYGASSGASRVYSYLTGAGVDVLAPRLSPQRPGGTRQVANALASVVTGTATRLDSSIARLGGITPPYPTTGDQSDVRLTTVSRGWWGADGAMPSLRQCLGIGPWGQRWFATPCRAADPHDGNFVGWWYRFKSRQHFVTQRSSTQPPIGSGTPRVRLPPGWRAR